MTALGDYVVQNAENHDKSPDEAKAEANRAEAVEWLRKGKALFERQDYNRMLAYIDILLTRYHDSEEAQWAALLNGKSLVAIGRHAKAGDRYHALLETHPDGPAAFEAALLLPQSLWLSGQRDGAAQAWLDFADRVGADEWRAYGYFNAGKYFSWLGTLPSQARAMDCFRKAKALYGTSPQATNVEREFTRLRRRGLADILPE